QRNVQTIVGGRCLQLEIERAAESFAKRQPPGFVDASAEWRVDDELHDAALIEESLGDDGLLRGNGAEYRASSGNIFRGLFGAGLIQSTFGLQPVHRFREITSIF